MSQNFSSRQATIVIVILAVVQTILQFSLLTKGVEYIAVSLVVDDTYYYLQSAWNAKALGFVTFDGLHATNGVQLLWFGIIFLLATLAKSKSVLLLTTLAVGFLLNGLCCLIILKIGLVLKKPVLALIMASLWTLQSLPFRIYSTGMENSLHALVFWCVIWQGLEFLIRVQDREKPNFWGLTITMILAVWTRLDSALISAVLFAFCVGMLAYSYRNNLKIFWLQHGKTIAGAGVLAGFGFIAQLTAFQLMGGSFLPVSALIKTSGTGGVSTIDWSDKLVEVFALGMPSILQGRFPTPALILIGISGILLVILARVTIRDHSSNLQAFLNLWLCLLFGETLYYIYIAISGAGYMPYFMWYRSPSFIFWIISWSLLAIFTFEHTTLAKQSVRGSQWAPVGLSVVIFAVAIYMFARSIDFTSKLYSARYKAALWIAENSPPDTVFASWNAGQLGFFSDRTFINLDGLINSVDYYERVLRGPVPLADYLIENKVDYIVDYSIYHPIPDYPEVQSFPLYDETGRSIHIWQVSSQLSLVP